MSNADNQRGMSLGNKLTMRTQQRDQAYELLLWAFELLRRALDLTPEDSPADIDELERQCEALLTKAEKYGWQPPRRCDCDKRVGECCPTCNPAKEDKMDMDRMIIKWCSFPRRGTDMEYMNVQTGVLLRHVKRNDRGQIEGYGKPMFVPGVNVLFQGDMDDAYFVPVA
jgi:hypothetical protein